MLGADLTRSVAAVLGKLAFCTVIGSRKGWLVATLSFLVQASTLARSTVSFTSPEASVVLGRLPWLQHDLGQEGQSGTGVVAQWVNLWPQYRHLK